jgi:hypothetical protein
MATTLKNTANRLNMTDPLPTRPSYGLKSGIFKPRRPSVLFPKCTRKEADLLFCAVVERLSLVYDMNRQKLKRLVADNLESSMWHFANIDRGDACRERYLFAIW